LCIPLELELELELLDEDDELASFRTQAGGNSFQPSRAHPTYRFIFSTR
jgi:hypothetical protein